MAFSTIIRRAASTIAPLANRAFRTQRNNYSSAIFSKKSTTTQELCKWTFVPVLLRNNFSSAVAKTKPSSDETLLRVIDSEIECALETDEHDRVEEVPTGFPFKIEDNLGDQTITLTREYEGEVIKVTVHMPDLVAGENEDDDQDDDAEKEGQTSIPLIVNVSKKDGPCLEFSVVAYPDEVSIDSLSVKDPNASEDQIAYEGPDFQDLDENLQKAFHKYLEIRGIKPSTTNFLHEYMINKDSKEYLAWLNNLKKFISS